MLPHQFLTSLQEQLAVGKPAALPLFALLSPLTAFFNVPMFLFLNLFLLLDFATGFYKAKLQNKVSSKEFGNVFFRMTLYTVVFIVFHSITIVMPVCQFIEATVFLGYLAKEGLSILENLKAIQELTGRKLLNIDKAINIFGMDLENILKDQVLLNGQSLTKPLVMQSVVEELKENNNKNQGG